MSTTFESDWENTRLKERIEELEDKVDSLEREIDAYESWKDIIKQRDALQADYALLREIATQLWDIIDDIDTYGDMAKSDDVLFRRLTENRQRDRWKTGITTDGQTLLFPTPKQSLARLRNQAIEKCAVELDGHWDMAAGIIRAMKEPE